MHSQPAVLASGCSRAAIALALGLTLTAAAGASTLSLHPTQIYLDAESTGSLLLKNRGEHPVSLQARVMAWSDRAGSDHLEPSRDLIAWPPVVEIEAGGQQVIRVAPERPIEGETEVSYRLLVTEIPTGRVEATVPGVRFSMEFSLPVFVNSAAAEPPLLDWSLEPTEADDYVVWATNRGGSHARVLSVVVRSEADPLQMVRVAQARYILPGARRGWPVPADEIAAIAGGLGLSIEAASSQGLMTARVEVPADIRLASRPLPPVSLPRP